MFDLYFGTVILPALIVFSIAVIGIVCSIGWLITEQELLKERKSKKILEAEIRKRIENGKAADSKHWFLHNELLKTREELLAETTRANNCEFLLKECTEERDSYKKKLQSYLRSARDTIDGDKQSNG